MTPREQIEKEDNLRFPPTKSIANSIIRAGFKEGAEYGYNLAIENVVEWLLKNTCERYNKSAYADVIATISLRVGCGAFNKEYLSNGKDLHN